MTSVLFVRLSAMGDLMQGMGAVAGLHRVRPDWRLTVVTQAAFAPLLDGLSGIHRVVPFERGAGLPGLRRVRQALRADAYDVALDLQGNWKSAVVAWLSGARRRVGMAPDFRQERWSHLLLHSTLASRGNAHPARCAWELVCSIAPDAPFLLPRLVPRDVEIEQERLALRAAGIDWRRPFRIVVRTDPRDPRALRPGIVDLETHRSGEPVVHLLGPDEGHVPAIEGIPTLRHGHSPRRLLALGAIVAQAGGVVLGPDQGAAHVLAAAGARCLVWFGAQEPARTSPPAAVALVHPSPPACSPCRHRRCRHPEGPVCMEFDSSQGRVVDLGLPLAQDRLADAQA